MRPKTADEKLLVLARAVRDLKRLREAAKSVDCGMLAFLCAQAQDEAQNQLETLEGEAFPEG